MKIASFTFVLIASFVCISVVESKQYGCSSYTTCQECTTRRSWWFGKRCYWCPVNNACHISWSFVGQCKRTENIQEADKCYHLTWGVYNPNLAYTSTLFSSAAYSNDPGKCLDGIFPGNGIKVVDKIGSQCEDSKFFKYKSCFAYTALSPSQKLIIVSFRGTAIGDQLIDEFWSTLTIPKQHFVIGGEVQSYFKHAYDGLYPCVNTSVHALVTKYPDYQVLVTGHSLGGALASLASAALVHYGVVSTSKMTLYTFGQPRVGDRTYAVNHEKLVNDSWRVVHYRDIVCHLPTCDILFGCDALTYTPYHHGIEIFYPHEDMHLGSRYIQCTEDEDRSCSDGLVMKHPCITDVHECVEYHKHYFGLEVGQHCKRHEAEHALYFKEEMVSGNSSVKTCKML